MAESVFIRFLLGKQAEEDRIEYNLALLRSQLALLIGFICLLYLVIDLSTGIFIFLPYQLLGLSAAIIILYLNKKGRRHLASVILLSILNLLIFLFAASDDLSRGVYFYFITSASFSLVLFYPKRRDLTYLFIILSIVLALTAILSDFRVFTAPETTDELKKTYFIINFSIAIVTTTLIILFSVTQLEKSRRELLENEEVLKERNRELNKVNMELDNFIYSASHDIRAPLSTVSGLLSLMQNSRSKEETEEYLRLADERLKSLDEFIGDITNYSRNVRTDPQISEVNIREIIEETVKSFSLLADNSKIRIDTNISEEVIQTDEKRIRVVIANLLSNSISYHNPMTEDRWISILCNRNNSQVELEVKDNGLGIPEKYKDRVFDMFFRASEKSKGSGLGLYIANEMVKKLNGSIKLNSDQQSGTTFKVILPDH